MLSRDFAQLPQCSDEPLMMFFHICRGKGQRDLILWLCCWKDLRSFSFILEQNEFYCKRKTPPSEGPGSQLLRRGGPGGKSLFTAGPATSTTAPSWDARACTGVSVWKTARLGGEEGEQPEASGLKPLRQSQPSSLGRALTLDLI